MSTSKVVDIYVTDDEMDLIQAGALNPLETESCRTPWSPNDVMIMITDGMNINGDDSLFSDYDLNIEVNDPFDYAEWLLENGLKEYVARAETPKDSPDIVDSHGVGYRFHILLHDDVQFFIEETLVKLSNNNSIPLGVSIKRTKIDY